MHCRLDKDRIQDSRLQQQNQHSSEGLDSSGLVDHEDDHGGNHVLNELDPAPQPFHYLYKFIITFIQTSDIIITYRSLCPD